MQTESQRAQLESRFQSMKAQDGLVDMKFHLGLVAEATTESVCAEVNRLLDNIQDGRVHEMEPWGDSRRAV